VKWALLALLLTGCATTTQMPERVEVPVGVSCLPKSGIPAKPDTYSDAQLQAMDDYKIVLALRQNATRLADYAAQLEALLVACR
jgi:hypothetical protein